ncbi:Serine/threonine protein kinase [Asanoa hainanensis]|uniref:non-specific serine/threonine protein kinase n=1 Tax=Asanoa hainanensis TaxID=560556 RepID=A0A239P7V6_9ACTN|nr:serine/threonine-protein kinase [Asanoa hainanensis]SNT62983.1 Serine/threonine protein kinase [Asanoa hainanensis]
MQRTLIAERYRLLESVGSGGMGRVWLARDEMLHRDVAVKEVQPPEWMSAAERAELGQRTLREARTAARLSHPNVVQIYDVVYAQGSPWIVMEYVRSRSLHEVIESEGPLAPERAAAIGLKILDALCAAHSRGVLHRDVKPHNVLISEDDGRVVLTDFGLATFDGDSSVTRQGMVMGSPQYVAPERASDGTSTPEADMWSLGATLYAAVEGRSPFFRRTTLATLTALATSPPDPAKLAGPLRPVLTGLLRKDPRQRLTADDVDRLLRRVLDPTVKPRPRRLPRPRRPESATTQQVDPSSAPTVALDPDGRPRATTWFGRGPTERLGGSGRRRVAVAGAGVLAALLLAGTAWALNRPGGDPTAVRSTGPSSTTRAAGAGGGLLPCQAPADAVTDTVRETPLPADEKYGLTSGLTWYSSPFGYRFPAPIGWRAYTEAAGTTCLYDPDMERLMSVEELPAPQADPVGYWQRQAQLEQRSGRLVGYAEATIDGSDLFDGGAEWQFDFLDGAGTTQRVIRFLHNVGSRAYVITWACPVLDWDPAVVRVIRVGFRPPV